MIDTVALVPSIGVLCDNNFANEGEWNNRMISHRCWRRQVTIYCIAGELDGHGWRPVIGRVCGGIKVSKGYTCRMFIGVGPEVVTA
jgi:hypothetical protein